MIRANVHRAALNGRSVCGASGRLSTSGAAVTCRFCQAATSPIEPSTAIAQIEAAATAFRSASHMITRDCPCDRCDAFYREHPEDGLPAFGDVS